MEDGHLKRNYKQKRKKCWEEKNLSEMTLASALLLVPEKESHDEIPKRQSANK